MLPLVGGETKDGCRRWKPLSQGSWSGGFKSSCSPGAAGCWVHLAWVSVGRPVWISQVGVAVGGEETLLVLGSHLPAHLLQLPQGPASESKRAQALEM